MIKFDLIGTVMVIWNMDDKKTNSTPPENTFYIRSEIPLDEIQKMLSDIGQVLSQYKAEKQGIDPKNMIKTVRGGRTIWITKEEMNTVLAKQRKLNPQKFVQRSERGEGSLLAEINRRIDTCKAIGQVLKKVNPDMTAGITKKLRNLEWVNNRTLGLAKEIRILETAIQRKKTEDPIFSEIDKSTTEMVSAVEKNLLPEVEVCQSFCNHRMDDYMMKQKRIEPYIKKAREYRLEFLQSKRQLFQIEFELLSDGEALFAGPLQEIVYRDKESQDAEKLVNMAKQIQSLVDSARHQFLTLEEYSVEVLEKREELFDQLDRDYLEPLLRQTLEFADNLQQAWSKHVTG